MPANLDRIGEGQEVVSIDGVDLGTVTHVWRDLTGTGIEGVTPDAGEWTAPRDMGVGGDTSATMQEARILESIEARGTNAGDIGASQATGGISGPQSPSQSPGQGPAALSAEGLGIPGYLEVSGRSGLLGTRHLYVPFSAVHDVEDTVTLEVTEDQAHDLYGSKPEVLQ